MATKLCPCKTRRGATAYYWLPEGKKNEKVWVCSDCLHPMLANYEGYLERCEDCLDDFSSPWEEKCEKCHTIEYSKLNLCDGRVIREPLPNAPEWKGWVWGAREEQLARTEKAERGRRSAIRINAELDRKKEISS